MSAVLPAPALAGKPAPRTPARHIAILEYPSARDPEGWFAFKISFSATLARSQAVRVETWHYLAREIPAGGMGHGCRGFEVEKLSGTMAPTGEVYHVLLDPRDGYSSCDCAGGTHHGHCKHREGLEHLVKLGRLAPCPYRSAGDLARNDPEEYARHMAAVAGDEYPGELPPPAWEYPDEPPELAPEADYEPGEEGPDPEPNRAA